MRRAVDDVRTPHRYTPALTSLLRAQICVSGTVTAEDAINAVRREHFRSGPTTEEHGGSFRGSRPASREGCEHGQPPSELP